MSDSETEESGRLSSFSSSSSLFRRVGAGDVQYKAYQEHVKYVRQYAMGRKLGEGSYAKVKEAVDLKSGRRVAIKIFDRRSLRKMTGGELSVQREIAIMRPLKHDNIVELFEDFVDEEKDQLYIVLEYMGSGTLQSLLDRAPGRRLPLNQARKLFANLVSGLSYLHSLKIVHRDIKPDNLLLTTTGELNISDFGCAGIASSSPLAKKRNAELSAPGGIGSPAYQAPELVSSTSVSEDTDTEGGGLSHKPITELCYEADIWSAGVVLFVTVTGEFPFANRNNMLMLFEDIAKGNYKIPEWVTAELRDLLQRLLTVDPKKRITLAEIKDHPWMDMELPKTTPVPLESAQSLFGQDQKALQASVKKLRISSAVNSATQSRNASRNPSRNASRNPSRNASRTSSCSDSGDERDGSDTEYSSLSSDGRRSNASSSPDSRKRNGSQKSRDNGKTQRRSSGRSRHHKRCPASDDEDEPPERRPSIESGSSNSKHGKSKRVCTIM